MKHRILRSIAIALSSLVLPAIASGADLAVTSLRCEYLKNPEGIDIAQPRLSWKLTSQLRGQKQTAYQVLVASSAEVLEEGKGDLWDSGKGG